MRESIKERVESRKVLKDQQVQTPAEVTKLKARLNSSDASGREERQKYLKLERDLTAATTQIEQLKADSGHKEDEIDTLTGLYPSLEKRHDDMRQQLQSCNEELQRFQGLAVELGTETLATT